MTESRHQPIRTCVGCRSRDRQAALVRIARVGDALALDSRRRLPGRGVYVHEQCLDRAIERGGLARGFRARVSAGAAAAIKLELEASLGHGQARGEHEQVPGNGSREPREQRQQ